MENGSPVCFVCGNQGFSNNLLYVTPQLQTPYFPFLQHHETPKGYLPVTSDGKVYSCYVCYTFLNQQWDSQEKDKIPIQDRIYWLKRVDGKSFLGAKCIEDIENSSNHDVLEENSIHSFSCKCAVCTQKANINSAAESHSELNLGVHCEAPLDLSNKDLVRCSKSPEPYIAQRSVSNTPTNQFSETRNMVLDLSMPDKDALTEVCYICGEEFKRGSLTFIHAKTNPSGIYFPSLLLHPRPSGSRPMDSFGRVQGCEACKKHLLIQWHSFQAKNVNHNDRNYMLRRRNIEYNQYSTFICYTCGLEYPTSSSCVLYTRLNSEGEAFYPAIENLKPPPGALPISSNGSAQVCSICYKSFPKKQRFSISNENIPTIEVESGKQSTVLEEEKNINGDVKDLRFDPLPVTTSSNSLLTSCLICHQVQKRDILKQILVNNEGKTNTGMLLPFLSKLHSTNNNLDNGFLEVILCNSCFLYLKKQWDNFETQKVPLSIRKYALPSNIWSADSKASDALFPNEEKMMKVWSSESKISPKPTYSDPIATTLDSNYMSAHSYDSVLKVRLEDKEGNENRCAACNSQCVCNYKLRTVPGNNPKVPFFPFLSSCKLVNGEAPVCFTCFHILNRQWIKYEESPTTSYDHRKYTTDVIICFLCEVEISRGSQFMLNEKEFSLIKSLEGLNARQGDEISVCRNCYSIVVDLKPIVNDRSPQTLLSGSQVKNEYQPFHSVKDFCLPFSSKKLGMSPNSKGSGNHHLHMKVNRTTATVPPLPQAPQSPVGLMTSPTGGLSSTVRSLVPPHLATSPAGNSGLGVADIVGSRGSGASSFAAALRNLAKQAGDSNPVSSQSGSSNPPVVTIAPTQSFSNLKESSYTSDRGMNFGSGTVGLPSLSSDPHRGRITENGLLRSTSSSFLDPLGRGSAFTAHSENLLRSHLPHEGLVQTTSAPSTPSFFGDPSRADSSLFGLRGFQPYRADSSHLSHLAGIDPATFSSYQSAYLASHLPPAHLRLEEQLYLERLGLLRPHVLGLGSGIIPSVSPYLPPDMIMNPLLLGGANSSILHDRIRMEAEHQRLRDMERERDRDRQKEKERERDRSNREASKASEESKSHRDRDRSPLARKMESPSRPEGVKLSNKSSESSPLAANIPVKQAVLEASDEVTCNSQSNPRTLFRPHEIGQKAQDKKLTESPSVVNVPITNLKFSVDNIQKLNGSDSCSPEVNRESPKHKIDCKTNLFRPHEDLSGDFKPLPLSPSKSTKCANNVIVNKSSTGETVPDNSDKNASCDKVEASVLATQEQDSQENMCKGQEGGLVGIDIVNNCDIKCKKIDLDSMLTSLPQKLPVPEDGIGSSQTITSSVDMLSSILPFPPLYQAHSLNLCPSYPNKVVFLEKIKLQPLSPVQREEKEKVWQGVMQESLRRKGILPKFNAWHHATDYLAHGGYYKDIDKLDNIGCSQAVTDQPSDGHSESEEELSKQSFDWPGIEMVVESYRKYILEQEVEGEVLEQHCKQLHMYQIELQNLVNCHSTRLASMAHEKEELEKDQIHLQTTIKRIKDCIGSLS